MSQNSKDKFSEYVWYAIWTIIIIWFTSRRNTTHPSNDANYDNITSHSSISSPFKYITTDWVNLPILDWFSPIDKSQEKEILQSLWESTKNESIESMITKVDNGNIELYMLWKIYLKDVYDIDNMITDSNSIKEFFKILYNWNIPDYLEIKNDVYFSSTWIKRIRAMWIYWNTWKTTFITIKKWTLYTIIFTTNKSKLMSDQDIFNVINYTKIN